MTQQFSYFLLCTTVIISSYALQPQNTAVSQYGHNAITVLPTCAHCLQATAQDQNTKESRQQGQTRSFVVMVVMNVMQPHAAAWLEQKSSIELLI